MFNYIHQLYFTFKNKIRREKRKKNLQIIPIQKNNYLNFKGYKVFDPIIFTPNFISQEIKSPIYNKKILQILNNQEDEPYANFVKHD